MNCWLPIRKTCRMSALFVALALACHSAATEAAPRFEANALPVITYGTSPEIGVANDGTLLLSHHPSVHDGSVAFPVVWSDCGGLIELSNTKGDFEMDFVSDVTDDVQWFVGYGRVGSDSTKEAFRMSIYGDIERLGKPDFHTYSQASAVSDDGRVIVGHAGPGIFRWVDGTGFELIDIDGYVQDISADGDVVVGQSDGHAVRWTPATGIHTLDLTTDWQISQATAVSADGRVIGGVYSAHEGEFVSGFRWTEEGGIEDLGNIRPSAVSNDGSVIVGEPVRGGIDAMIWTMNQGLRQVANIPGIEFETTDQLADWTFLSAVDVSGDGNIVAGWGRISNNTRRVWRLTLDPNQVATPPDTDDDGVCDYSDVCQGDDASGDIDNDGLCDDIDEVDDRASPDVDTESDNGSLPREVTCPSNIVVEATSPEGAVVNYDMPALAARSNGRSLVASRSSGTVFPIGTSVINVYDVEAGEQPSAGNLVCSFAVDVIADRAFVNESLDSPIACFNLGAEAALLAPIAGFCLVRNRRRRR